MQARAIDSAGDAAIVFSCFAASSNAFPLLRTENAIDSAGARALLASLGNSGTLLRPYNACSTQTPPVQSLASRGRTETAYAGTSIRTETAYVGTTMCGTELAYAGTSTIDLKVLCELRPGMIGS
eukprot:3908927-Rhodomonas_salina.1